ncbi:GT2 family glycosyltransferase [Streptosporangium becharense]|uniref:GT2 family glycosyltransferase n=1 Tax=Streptosporangium becharense TaxID=1816182 RepID=A0A7W9MFR9_9ACTN|nr:glycosyltransferase family 2 protein [Streptosporangium becharense]MBB2912046.1 GT2 family glycosyltransferase [Streptosporangium becharense]MBB5818593.1 GT2 family glycosyltransferase [Streptosporangium becharense]
MITVVVPTIGRAGLAATLAALDEDLDVIVVDDRPGRRGADAPQGAGAPRGSDAPYGFGAPHGAGAPADDPVAAAVAAAPRIRVLRSGGRGPAAARNVGWRAARTPWVAFLDDDVVPRPGWADALRADLAGLPEEVAGSQGRIEVPLPPDRRPTDAERNTAGLAAAHWITADMAYRRSALERVGGFDERFPRAYREDADLALRMLAAGYRLVRGERVTLHPIPDGGLWHSVRLQRGNADDALMRRLHGPHWRAAVRAPGRLRRHALVTGLGVLALGAAALRSPRTAALAGAAWALLTAEFAWARIAPGPRTGREIRWMAITSAVIPPVACAYRVRGELRVRR